MENSKTFTFRKSTFIITSIVLILVVFLGGIIAGNRGLDNQLVKWQIPGVSSLLTTGETSRFEQVRKLILSESYYLPGKDRLLEGALSGMAASFNDPYSFYLNKEYNTAVKQDEQGQRVGIGVSVSVNPTTKVIEIVDVYPQYSAGKAGVKNGDIITKIDGKSFVGKDLNAVASAVKGAAGSHVKLTVTRAGKELTFDLVRQNIITQMVKTRLIDGYQYIQLSGFEGKAVEQFQAALITAEQNKAKGVIIDLRWNRGGGLDIFTKIADMILPTGNLIYLKNNRGEKEYTRATTAQAYKKPVVVLVNGQSASASEAFAGCIQDYKYGVLVGTKTFGKGCAQTTYDLGDGTALRLTTAYYYLPKDRCIQGKGLIPDYTVDLPANIKADLSLLKDSNDTQLQKALAVIKTMKDK